MPRAGSKPCVMPSPGATTCSHPRNRLSFAAWPFSSVASRSRRRKLWRTLRMPQRSMWSRRSPRSSTRVCSSKKRSPAARHGTACWKRSANSPWSNWQEARGWLVRLLALAEAVDDVELTVRAMALTGAGWLAHYFRELGQNDFAAARAALEEGRERYQRLGQTDSLVDVLVGQSWVAQSLGEHRRAAELCEEALALSRKLGDHVRIA